MAGYPQKLQQMVDLFALVGDRAERIEMLIALAGKFREVPSRIATRPFPESRRTPNCESQAYVWAEELPDRTLKFHFAVENPQGISAKATAAILDQTLSGAPPEEVAQMPADFINRIFGNELSMGKSMGLMGMVAMVQAEARRYLARCGQAT